MSRSLSVFKTTHGPIVWLSLIGTIAVAFLASFFLCWRHRRRERAREVELQRMEANVKTFSERQERRRKKVLQRALRSQGVVGSGKNHEERSCRNLNSPFDRRLRLRKHQLLPPTSRVVS